MEIGYFIIRRPILFKTETLICEFQRVFIWLQQASLQLVSIEPSTEH